MISIGLIVYIVLSVGIEESNGKWNHHRMLRYPGPVPMLLVLPASFHLPCPLTLHPKNAHTQLIFSLQKVNYPLVIERESDKVITASIVEMSAKYYRSGHSDGKYCAVRRFDNSQGLHVMTTQILH
jgi:hypothetical protein